jgi:hypothetical protein
MRFKTLVGFIVWGLPFMVMASSLSLTTGTGVYPSELNLIEQNGPHEYSLGYLYKDGDGYPHLTYKQSDWFSISGPVQSRLSTKDDWIQEAFLPETAALSFNYKSLRLVGLIGDLSYVRASAFNMTLSGSLSTTPTIGLGYLLPFKSGSLKSSLLLNEKETGYSIKGLLDYSLFGLSARSSLTIQDASFLLIDTDYQTSAQFYSVARQLLSKTTLVHSMSYSESSLSIGLKSQYVLESSDYLLSLHISNYFLTKYSAGVLVQTGSLDPVNASLYFSWTEHV